MAPIHPTGALVESLKFRHIVRAGSPNTINIEQTAGSVELPPRRNTNVPPASADPFVGRQVMLYELAKAISPDKNLDEPRLIHLKAMGVIGKTALGICFCAMAL